MIPGDPGDVWSWTSNDEPPPPAVASSGMRYRYGYRNHWSYLWVFLGGWWRWEW